MASSTAGFGVADDARDGGKTPSQTSFSGIDQSVRRTNRQRGIDLAMEIDDLAIGCLANADIVHLAQTGDFGGKQLHIVERFTRTDPYHLNYEATIEDPTVFTRPWKISMPLYRKVEKNAQLLEFKCVEFSEELLYGKFKKSN